MVSVSTRRLPWTTICVPADAFGAANVVLGAKQPTRLTPRSKPATTSPRLTHTHIFMRYAPSFPTWPPPTGGSLKDPLSFASFVLVSSPVPHHRPVRHDFIPAIALQ